ncbi:MAG: HYR domain-containing protein [Verrucomicrobia bacterium]|nr:MAG: HYR domain-containing protein [Verrucomicrobiota bacterium]
MNTWNVMQTKFRLRRLAALALTALACLSLIAESRAASFTLQGQSRGDTNWLNGNLQNWRELDYIPCRVAITGGPLNNQLIRIDFPHLIGTTPGFQNLDKFTPSSNALITSGPTLVMSPSGVWSYTFTVTVLNSSPAEIQFRARLAAGSHLNTGSSLALSGSPTSMGTLQIHKPAPGPGAPDLAITKIGPATALQGSTISYVLSYTNRTGTQTAVGAQISDILPGGLTVDTNSLSTNADLVGNTIFWDLPTLPGFANGQVTFQAQVSPTATPGSVITNFCQILSSEDDADFSNNTSTWLTTILSGCVPPGIQTNPASLVRCAGDSASFSAAASGTAPLSYQWRKNGGNIAGANAATYTIPSVTPADAASYDVVVTNACGTATSSAATLSLNSPTTATSLTSKTNCPGGTVTFSTTAGGTGPFSYAWFKDGNALPTPTNNTLTLNPVTLGDAGLYSVVVSGLCNSVTNSATLTVTPQPVINCVAGKTVECGAAWNFDAPSFSGGALSILSTITNAACGNTFSATRTWQVTDACGNSAQCSQTVAVADTTAPVITCAAGKSVEAGSSFGFDAPTATDTCGTNSISIVSTVTNAAGCSYSVTRIWRATDACGNSATCAQTISVVDTTAPTITCAANKNVEAGAAFNFDAPSATDIGSTNSITIVSTVTNAAGCSYSATRTWSATDACGNSATCSQVISVVDTTAPTITCAANKNVEAGAAFNFDVPTATDIGGTNSISIVSTVTNAAGCGYSVTRTWRATDACGNSATCTQTISVVDTTAPTITCAANKNVEAGAAFNFDTPSATDIGGTNSISIVSTVTNAAGCSYSVTRTWRATDACGNSATCAQTISVVDTTAPTITCATNKSVEAGAAFSFDAPTATDIGGTNTISIVSTVTNTVGCNYNLVRTWRATDACGNSATCSQTISVVDTTAPVITCSSNKTVECGSVWTFDAPTVTGGSVSSLTTVTNAACGNTFIATRTYAATDACGNLAQCSQTVTVVDTTPPVITCATNKTVLFNVAWTFDAPTATDACGTNSISMVSTVTNSGCGANLTTTRTWRATDACGNSSDCSQTVTVVDTRTPSLNCVANKSVECGTAWTFDVPGVTDGAITNFTTLTNAACGNTFTATRTWTAADVCGHTAQCSQTVAVIDTTAPVINCASNKNVEAGAAFGFNQPTATDLCGTNSISIVSTVTNAAGCSYSVTRTWRATDACGNSATCAQTISVVDTTAPTITCAANKNVEAGAAFSFDAPTATDIGGTNSISIVSTLTNTAGCSYSVTRTWRATDACGNSATCAQTISVVDTTAPTITCAANKNVEAGAAFSFDAPTATDIGGTNSISIISTVTNAAGCSYSVTRTWRATDACGNSATCTQTISVVDTTAPTITCAANKNVEAGAAFSFDAPTATDIAGTNTISVISTVTNAAGCSYNVTRTWQAMDACGNSATCSQVISVLDTTAPTITCSADKNVEAGAAFSFDAPTATDIAGTNSISIVSTLTNTAGCSYSVTRTWRATDACGNSATCSQRITVTDFTAPTVTIVIPTNTSVYLAPANVPVVANVFDASQSVSNVDFFLGTNKIATVSGSGSFGLTLSNLTAGSYTLHASAVDACGNVGVSTQVTFSVIASAPLTIVSALAWDPQTDLFKETVRVFNPTGSEFNAVRVNIQNLSANTIVWNKSGTNGAGVPYVQSNNRVSPGGFVDLVIEYYNSFRLTPTRTLTAELVNPTDGGGAAVSGLPAHLNRGVMLPNRTFLLEFNSVSNATYYVQYSTDLKNWKTVQPAITGTGSILQWIDNGQPKTDSAPSATAMRFYQLIVLP